MKISIAMATYNGAKYIKKQFESFALQSWLPDEVIVNDDCSTDNTVNIIKEISKLMPFQVQISINKTNVGYTKNFGKAIEKCSGDIIFLSDQDDYWLSKKIEFISEYFRNNPATLVAATDAEIATENLVPTGYTKLVQAKKLGFKKDRFITGCCTAFLSKLIPIICPIPFDKYPYDAWIHSIGNLLSARVIIEKPLIYLRRHQSNASYSLINTTGKVSKFQYLLPKNRGNPYLWLEERLWSYDIFFDRFQNQSSLRTNYQQLESIKKKIDIEKRAVSKRLYVLSLPFHLKLLKGSIYFAAGGYKEFSGFNTFIKDCFFTKSAKGKAVC